jgi:hypothetical protein
LLHIDLMKFAQLLILLFPLTLFANTKEMLSDIDRSQLSTEQAVLLDKALQQESVEVIELNEEDLHKFQKKKHKLKIRDIKRWLKTTDQTQTCLDEYLKIRKRQLFMPVMLLVDTSLGVFVAVASGGWVPTLTASYAFIRYFLSETIASRVMRLRYPNAIPGHWPAREFDAIAQSITVLSLVPYYVGAGVNLVKVINTGLIMKAIANAKEGFQSKHLAKFKRKYLKRYPADIDLITDERLAEILNTADEENLFCNGDIVREFNPRRFRRGRRLKQRLARKKEIFQYIHTQL